MDGWRDGRIGVYGRVSAWTVALARGTMKQGCTPGC